MTIAGAGTTASSHAPRGGGDTVGRQRGRHASRLARLRRELHDARTAELSAANHLAAWHRDPDGVTAREHTAGYDVTAPPTDASDVDGSPDAPLRREPDVRSWDTFDAALDGLRAIDVDALSVEGMQESIRRMQRRIARLEALRDGWISSLRRAERARAPRGKAAVGDQVTDEFLTQDLLLSPSQAKRARTVDQQLGWAPRTRAAFAAGDISKDHASVIGQVLAEVPLDDRDAMEAQLLDLATRLHPVALRREATRLVAEVDHASAEDAARRRHLQRRATWTRDTDGGLQLHATLHGRQAEVAEVALRAATARRSDDDTRTDDQRRADALVSLFDLALRARELPATHGVRPHVLVTVDQVTLERGYGTATLGSGTTVPLTELAPVLSDCVLTRVVLDADGAPCEASVGVRTVPRGLVTLLHARDRHCVWPGCDRPAVWCQIAHTDTPHGAGGRLTISNTALLCEAHHTRYDAGGWRIDIDGPDVTLHRDPTRPPAWSIVAAHRRAEGSSAANRPRPAASRQGRASTAPPPRGEPPTSPSSGGSPRDGDEPPATLFGPDPPT